MRVRHFLTLCCDWMRVRHFGSTSYVSPQKPRKFLWKITEISWFFIYISFIPWVPWGTLNPPLINPVYERSVERSVLVFSLSSHRHLYIGLLFGEEGMCQYYERRSDKVSGNWNLSHTRWNGEIPHWCHESLWYTVKYTSLVYLDRLYLSLSTYTLRYESRGLWQTIWSLLWIDKVRVKDKTYLGVSVWWKTKN